MLFDIGGTDDASLASLWTTIDTDCGGRLAAVVISHAHDDHHAGLVHVHARFPEVSVYAHSRIARSLGARYTEAGIAIGSLDTDAGDGPIVRWGLEFWLTEGHASGHLSVVHPDFVLCADMMAGLGTILVAPPDGSMRAYFASLARLATLGDRVCYPAHGPELASTAGYAQAFLAHRSAREAKILGAFRGDALTLTELTRRAYDDVGEETLPLAEIAAYAHVLKLAEEGTITAEGVLWRLVAPA